MTEPRVVSGMSDTEYHQRPELSSTGARLLLPEYQGSPKKFRYAQGHPRTSRAFDVGHAVHAKVLGVGAGAVEYPEEHLTPSGNVSTKAATVEWESGVRAAGLVPVSPDEAARVNAMAEAILVHPTAQPLFEIATGREVSAFNVVDGVPCRARFDALSEPTRRGTIAIDLKTGDDATKVGFERAVAKWGYDVQAAFYDDVWPVDEFYFVVIERNPPFEVGVFLLPEMWASMGKRKAAEARRIYAECTAADMWPGYDPTIQYLDPPTWLVFDHETRYESEAINV